MTVLDELASYARERVASSKLITPPDEMREKAILAVSARAKEARAAGVSVSSGSGGTGDPDGFEFPFEKALSKPGLSFICECKKASPSKGIIADDFPYIQIAREYEAAGADAISVLTEPKWFLGSDSYLKEITSSVGIPCIRKDFTVDEYMIYEAVLLGASAVLLIVSILSPEKLSEYIRICDRLGLSSLVEAHDESEVRTALDAGARIIGVNNRNLKDFSVDVSNSGKLRRLIPEDVIFVSESGVGGREDIRRLEDIGADAVLIGETLMRAPDKKRKLDELKGVL